MNDKTNLVPLCVSYEPFAVCKIIRFFDLNVFAYQVQKKERCARLKQIIMECFMVRFLST